MKFFLKPFYEAHKVEVTKEQWILAERHAGFRPKCSSDDPQYWTEPATGGFSGSGMNGSITYEPSDFED